ncbi:hypothetical protein WA556_000737 [Blastocystis sp. ATCC 50177/Nand II]
MSYNSSLFTPPESGEPDSFRNIVNEYDPSKPNSYLLVCEKRKQEEEENDKVFRVKQQLEENERHMQEERKKLEEDIRSGKIFGNGESTGIGRGVAMTLPAWMTQKKA